jgi:2-amino-4-hydroxy-6-hydroxymethyldihydropteridine diphosphokinase
MMNAQVTAYIGLGSNLGDSCSNVQRALLELERLAETRLTGRSCLFRTAPLDADGSDYINAVARVDTQLPAIELLEKLQALELAFGRQRPYFNAPRTLDLDILLYGQIEILSDVLTVPHPRLTERAFALIPLLQIDPLISIPGRGPACHFVVAVERQKITQI